MFTVLASGKYFQPSLILTSESGAYPIEEPHGPTLLALHTNIRLDKINFQTKTL
jgi:hypothetical protein